MNDGDLLSRMNKEFELQQLKELDKTLDSMIHLKPPPAKQNPLDIQIAGGHYKDCKIQPVEYVHANGLDFFQGSVIKYITRFRSKNGIEDLKKAKHFIDLLIKLEYNE